MVYVETAEYFSQDWTMTDHVTKRMPYLQTAGANDENITPDEVENDWYIQSSNAKFYLGDDYDHSTNYQ